ncbi:hypothetical protein TNCV_2885301 [Trichonephila clavipes]|nr:hypothetical protein TNCV_2885301 [Trichonephila clavipes]
MQVGSVVWTGKGEKEKWDDKKRVKNREGSLGYPGFVKPMFTKDSKPLGKIGKITRVPQDCDTRTHLKKDKSRLETNHLVKNCLDVETIQSKQNRKATSTRVTSMVTASIGKAISVATLRQILYMNGLYARVPRVCVPLSVQSRGARLK